MTRAEAIEVTRIHSVAGLHADGLISRRPFRAPHHTISPAGLVGGGSPPRPGEATLAHRGVLFLDELSEFQRSTLDALRQPLEDGSVDDRPRPARARVPDRVHAGGGDEPVPLRVCRRRRPLQLRRGRARAPPAPAQRAAARPHGPARRRRAADRAGARGPARPRRRLGAARAASPTPASASAPACRDRRVLQRRDGRAAGPPRTCSSTRRAERALARAYSVGALSARGRHRVLRVARTIADLERHRAGHPRRRR